jgi:hypothetical protein
LPRRVFSIPHLTPSLSLLYPHSSPHMHLIPLAPLSFLPPQDSLDSMPDFSLLQALGLPSPSTFLLPEVAPSPRPHTPGGFNSPSSWLGPTAALASVAAAAAGGGPGLSPRRAPLSPSAGLFGVASLRDQGPAAPYNSMTGRCSLACMCVCLIGGCFSSTPDLPGWSIPHLQCTSLHFLTPPSQLRLPRQSHFLAGAERCRCRRQGGAIPEGVEGGAAGALEAARRSVSHLLAQAECAVEGGSATSQNLSPKQRSGMGRLNSDPSTAFRKGGSNSQPMPAPEPEPAPLVLWLEDKRCRRSQRERVLICPDEFYWSPTALAEKKRLAIFILRARALTGLRTNLPSAAQHLEPRGGSSALINLQGMDRSSIQPAETLPTQKHLHNPEMPERSRERERCSYSHIHTYGPSHSLAALSLL